MQSLFGAQQDSAYMLLALQQAHKAYQCDEVPIGAIIVNTYNQIIAGAYNRVESMYTQCAHAELLALQQAGQYAQDWRLYGCWIYVTLQPCSMCMHAIKLHRIAGVVYAADSPLFGYPIKGEEFDSLYKNDTIQILSGIEKDKSEQLLRQFFKQKRKENG